MTTDTITICDGLKVPLPALRWLWAAEDRGLDIRLNDDTLVVEPAAALTGHDRALLQQHREVLSAVVWWCAADSEEALPW